MEVANHIILIVAVLVTFAIFASVLSSRIGAPVLLVFLGLGMLAGEDGLGGIQFSDFKVAYLIGSVALALILFDGGSRTRRDAFKQAGAPALILATAGVVFTALITGVATHYLLGLEWVEAMLLGTIVGSTDAAAVFSLLHLKGLRLKQRVAATLEVESGINDPMAIFLTLILVQVAASGESLQHAIAHPLPLLWDFAWQLVGGIIFGVIGGQIVLRAVNRLQLSAGLYPILACALALVVFATTQAAGASGFLAIYLVGYRLGNNAHRATAEIARFLDGMAWLSQIGLFLMMGLLVTPSRLLPILLPALAISAVLMLVARPVAVALCIWPFNFTRKEGAFISWVGLRGAVPIFLAMIPVMSGLHNAYVIFAVAYVVVLTSLIAQGWTVPRIARMAGLELPPRPSPRARVELGLPAGVGRSVVAYTVDPMSIMALRRPRRLPLPAGTEILSVMSDGQVRTLQPGDGFNGGDIVMLLTEPDALPSLDRLFGARKARPKAKGIGPVDFTLDAGANAGEVAEMYGFMVTPHERDLSLAGLMQARLGREIEIGQRIRAGSVELVAIGIDAERAPSKVGLDLDPPPPQSAMTLLRLRANEIRNSVREMFLS